MKKYFFYRTYIISYCLIIAYCSISAQTNPTVEQEHKKLGNPKTLSASKSSIDQIWEHYNALYGLDFDLYSGRKYYPTHKNDSGTPFWLGDIPQSSNLVLLGTRYDSLLLLYDIFNQQFVLEFVNLSGGAQRLIVNSLRIDTVEINQCVFVKNTFPSINQKFIQIVYQDKISCYFGWQKMYSFKNSGKFTGHEYSNDIRVLYLDLNGTIVKFRNNKTFINVFEQNKRKFIRSYITENGINVKRAELVELQKLIEYCNNLY